MTMIEKVARAISEAEDAWRLKDGPLHEHIARAAFSAMRTIDDCYPSIPILVAGKKSLFACSEDPDIENARNCWQAMIDQILSPA